MRYSLDKKKLAFFAASFLIIFKCAAGIGTWDWRTHLSYHNPEKVVTAFGKIYTLCSGSIYSYDPEDTSVQTFDKVNTLSDSKIVQIAFSASENALLIIYHNGNIDFLYEDNDIFNLPDYKISDISDKTVNDIFIYNQYAYLSTNFGVEIGRAHV